MREACGGIGLQELTVQKRHTNCHSLSDSERNRLEQQCVFTHLIQKSRLEQIVSSQLFN